MRRILSLFTLAALFVGGVAAADNWDKYRLSDESRDTAIWHMNGWNNGGRSLDHRIENSNRVVMNLVAEVDRLKETTADLKRQLAVQKAEQPANLTLATVGADAPVTVPTGFNHHLTICTPTGCMVGTLVPSPVDPTCQRFMVGDVKKGVVKQGYFYPALDDDDFGPPVAIGGKAGAGACTCANCPVGANCGGQCGVQGCGAGGCQGCASCGQGASGGCSSGACASGGLFAGVASRHQARVERRHERREARHGGGGGASCGGGCSSCGH